MPRKPDPNVIKGFTVPTPALGAQAARVSATTAVWSRFRIRAVLNEPPVTLEMDIHMVAGGKPTLAGLAVESWADGGSVTTATLRAIPLDYVVRAAVAAAERPVSDLGNGLFRLPGDASETVRFFPADQRAAEAARIYRNASAQGSKAPTEAVALGMSVSRSQASRYVRAAREAGLLPRPGEPLETHEAHIGRAMQAPQRTTPEAVSRSVDAVRQARSGGQQ